MKMRSVWYACTSAALAAAVIASALHQRPNFYSAMVHLAQSSLSLMILVNFIFLIYASFVYGLQRLCFGQLRPVEIEQLYEKAWFAVTETCLAMTIFREEIGAFFLVMFTTLVTGKVWGWIGEGRVEVLEQQPPANPRLFHTRLSASLLFSVLYDCWLLRYAVNTVVQQARPTMMVMFLFEFAVLAISSSQTAVRYMISLVEARVVKVQTAQRLEERRRQVRQQREEILMRREREGVVEGEGEAREPLPNEDDVDEMDIEVPGWEAKGQWVLTLDLVADFLKLAIYSTFFCVLFTFYGLPIHIMRDLFLTTRSFVKRLGALLRYRQAVRDMNKYPDATAEELAREDTCIICREEMRPWDPANPGQVERSRPKKLPCGHILHFGCLKSWLERQQVCPTCRSSVVMDTPARAPNGDALVFRLGLNFPNGQNQQPPANGAAPGGGQAAQGVQNAQDPQQNGGGNAGVRMFNLGPLRLGFAQGGVRDMQDMAQHLGVPGDVANPQAANQAQPPQPRTGDANAGTTLESLNAQLMEVGQRVVDAGQRVQQDLQNLHSAEAQLQTLNLLFQEVLRLSQMQRSHQLQPPQQSATSPGPATAGAAGQVPPALPHPQPQPHFQQQLPPFAPPFPQIPGQPGPFPQMQPFRFVPPTVTRYSSAGQAADIPAGSPELPEGMVLPPGWSLLPLQRLDGTAPMPTGPATPSQPQAPTQTTNPLPEILQNLAQQIQNPRAGANGMTSPVAQETRAQETHGAPGPSSNARDPEAPSAPQQQTSAAGPSASDAQSDPPPVTAPTPVMPSWGGSAQLFGSGPGPGGPPFGYQRNQQPRSAPLTPSNVEETSESGGGGDGKQIAQPSSAVQDGGGEGSNGLAEADGAAVGKGKARAVTVEEGSDNEGHE